MLIYLFEERLPETDRKAVYRDIKKARNRIMSHLMDENEYAEHNNKARHKQYRIKQPRHAENP